MIDLENTISNLETNIRWIEDIPSHQFPGWGNVTMSMRDALELLKEQEPVDKNTGEWKNGHCSCCGEDVSSMLDTWTNVQSFLYCPKCGAKMEEPDDWFCADRERK